MLDRWNEALGMIESCLALGDPVDVAALARTAATSEHHYRRMFSTLAGMPVSAYIRRRRLTLAAADVVNDELSLLDVAVRHGYGSVEAFTRAFRAVHGISPGEVRRHGGGLVSQPRISFHLVVEGQSSMNYRIVEKDAFRIIGRKARVPLVQLGPNQAIIDFVSALDAGERERIAALSDQEPSGPLAITDAIDESRAEGTELDYWHAVVSSQAGPEDLDCMDVPAGTWVVFETEGQAPESMQYLWRDAYTEWFPSNPWRTRPGPELLRTELSEDGTQGRAQLWLPIEPECR